MIVDVLRDELGDDLHGVFHGDFVHADYSVPYLHDHDDLSHLVGDVELTIRQFEHSTHVLAWNSRENEGVFVGIAPDPSLLGPTVEAFRGTILPE